MARRKVRMFKCNSLGNEVNPCTAGGVALSLLRGGEDGDLRLMMCVAVAV